MTAWFENIKDKKLQRSFIGFDIIDFYPSITRFASQRSRLRHNLNPKQEDVVKKEICKISRSNNLQITIDVNKKVIDFLE